MGGRRWRQYNAVQSRNPRRNLHTDGNGHDGFGIFRPEPQCDAHAECLLGRGRGRNLIPACEGVVFIHRIRKRLPAGSPLITTDCWKPQARGQADSDPRLSPTVYRFRADHSAHGSWTQLAS